MWNRKITICLVSLLLSFNAEACRPASTPPSSPTPSPPPPPTNPPVESTTTEEIVQTTPSFPVSTTTTATPTTTTTAAPTTTTTTPTTTTTTASPTTTTEVFTRDLILDGGFEANNGSWSKQGCTTSVQQADVHAGTNALLVTSRTKSWAGPAQLVEVQTLLGVETATLSFAIKLVQEASFEFGWFVSYAVDGTTEYNSVFSDTITSDDGWKVFEKEIQFPDITGADSVKIYLQGSPVAAEFIIDDVSLVDTTERVIRPNILFISVDDLRPNLDLYKGGKSFLSPQIHSPNLNKLAENSIVFDNAYVQYAICGPSRTSILTGRRPDTTRVTNLEVYFRDLGGNFTTIPQFFKENGYNSISVGKVFHGQKSSPGDDPPSWDEVFHAAPRDITWPNPGNDDFDKYSWKKFTDAELSKPLVDTFEADWVNKKLKSLAPSAKAGVAPFFLAWGLHKPHLPFLFPEKYLDLYPEDSISLPNNPYVPEGMPDIAYSTWAELRTYEDCSKTAIGNDLLGNINVTLPDAKTKELRRAYYATVSYVDNEIGRVLEEVEQLGLADNTIIVVWSDHGWQLGEHAEWAKHTNFEIANRAPLIMHFPKNTTGGLRTTKLVEMVDIFPTLVEAAGFDPLDVCPGDSHGSALCTEGSSLLPLVANPNETEWKDAVFWQYGRRGLHANTQIPRKMGYTIRTQKYRYTEWVGIELLDDGAYQPDWDDQAATSELYDLEIDPEENINRIGYEYYKDVIPVLGQKLRDGWRKAQPQEKTWQEKADIRIDELRKSELVVQVDGFDNVEASTIKLEVTQLSHSFPFGTQVKAKAIKECVDTGVDNQYCTFAKENYNYIVTGNAMKWSYNEWKEGRFKYGDADATLAWAKERNMKARGHALMWATGAQTPPWVMNLTGTELINAIEKRIDDALTHFNGTVTGWDVNNEMTHGEHFLTLTGDPDIRVKMHNLAHEKDPSLELFTNDFNIINQYNGQSDVYFDLIKDLVDRGAAISGIGLQAHFQAIPIDPEKIIPIMEKLGEFNLPVWITEFDWNADTNGGPEHAAAVENFYRLMFSLEMVEGIVMWGYWDEYHWRPNSALINGDTFEVNAAGQAYLKLYHTEWNSSGTMEQYEPSKFQARVFHGDYNLVLSSGGTVLAERRVVVEKGSNLELTISA